MAERYDVIVVGGGPGGYPAAIRAAQLGRRVAIVEGARLGGVCLHRGCIPTKALLHVAETMHTIRRSGSLGITVDEASLQYEAVARYRDGVVGRLYAGVQGLVRRQGVSVIPGWARLIAPTAVEVVNDEGNVADELHAEDLILATGSRPQGLPGLEFDGNRILSSDHSVSLNRLPESVVIVGAGAVGTEFASFYTGVGVQHVTLIEALPRVLPAEDAEVSAQVEKHLRAQGVEVLTSARLLPETYRAREASFVCEVERAGERTALSASMMLIAVGRRANTEHLGLDELGVELAGGHVRVDGHMRTNVPRLYAVGDVVGGPLLAHKATAEGILAAEVICGQEVAPLNYTLIPRCTFSRPEVASFGLSEEEAIARGYGIRTGKFRFGANSRAMVEQDLDGFVKVVMDQDTEEILGVHAVGPRVTELIAGPVVAAFLEGTPYELGRSVHPHPTFSEALGEAALAAYDMAIHG